MYFKLLEIFILKTLFHKGEYNITSKEFNPIKFFIVLILVVNVFFSIYLMVQLSKIYDIIQVTCPQILTEKKEHVKELHKVKDKKT